MSRKVRRRLSPLRLACMVILLLGVLSTVVVLVRALPATAAGYLAAGLLGAAALPVMASPLEWLVHRHVYHRKLIPLTRRIFSSASK